jgi:hypothetical protein
MAGGVELCACGQQASAKCLRCGAWVCRRHYAVSEGRAPATVGSNPLAGRIVDELERRPARLGERFEPHLAVELWWKPTGAVCVACRQEHVQEHVEDCFQNTPVRLPPEPADPDARTIAALLLLTQPVVIHGNGYLTYDEAETEEVRRRCENLAERVFLLGPQRFGQLLANALVERQVLPTGTRVAPTRYLKLGWRRTENGWSINMSWALTKSGRWLGAAKTGGGSGGRAETYSTWVARWRSHDTFTDADWVSLHDSFAYQLGRASERVIREFQASEQEGRR